MVSGKMDLNNTLQIGQEYWVLTQPNIDRIIGEKTFNDVYLCILDCLHIGHFGEIIYLFKNVKLNWCFTLDEKDISHMVFNSLDDFYVFLVKYIKYKNIEYNSDYIEFDEFLLNKIKESQNVYPEKWI